MRGIVRVPYIGLKRILGEAIIRRAAVCIGQTIADAINRRVVVLGGVFVIDRNGYAVLPPR